jgi:hypothetical protein
MSSPISTCHCPHSPAPAGEVCPRCGKTVERTPATRATLTEDEKRKRIHDLERQMRQFQLQLQELKSQL